MENQAANSAGDGGTTEDLIRLSFFTDIAKAISGAQNLDQTLDEIMDQVGRIFAPRNWSLLLRDEGTGELTFTVVVGGEEAAKLRGHKIPQGHGVAGWIAEHGRPAIISDVHADERFDPAMDQLTEFRTKSIIGVPLQTSERVFGVIELINRMDGEAFTALDLKLLSTIADFGAIAIEKAYYVKALEKIANVDELTGLYNRRSLNRILEREVERCARDQESLVVLLVDLNGFKEINDRYGHAAGDEVLRRFAQLLDGTMRKVDFLCRYGGDEFVVVMPDARRADGETVKQRIESKLDEANDEREIAITASIGLYAGCPESVSELLREVDLEMYAEKRHEDSVNEQTIRNIHENLEHFLNEDREED
jgi:diguanylate cyclase (GGDEF)-like protein